jgi:hypothetical protein
MMTNRNELESEKHLTMTFVEFLEALTRVADCLEDLEDQFEEWKPKHPNRLDKKIESALLKIMKMLLNDK